MRALITLTLLLFSASAFAQQRGDSLFLKAIQDGSTAPYFVLFYLEDNAGHRDTICTEAPFLLGAIHSEFNLPYSTVGEREAERIAIEKVSRVFKFTKSKALDNVKPRYTKEILTEVRLRLESISTMDLAKQLQTLNNSPLHRLYNNRRKWPVYAAYRDAIAYILLTRGIPVRRGDRAGYLFTD